MQEFEITIERKARFCRLGEPGKNITNLWFVCHGYGHLAAFFVRHFQPLDDGTSLIVAPEGLSRFYLNGFSGRVGASWMTKECRLAEIEDYVGYLDAVYHQVRAEVRSSPVRVVILGFSQGAATAARWLAKGRVTADALVLWAGLMPPELGSDEYIEKLRAIDLTMVYGKQDEYANADSLDRQLHFFDEHKLQHELISFEGGHEINETALLKLAARIRNLPANEA